MKLVIPLLLIILLLSCKSTKPTQGPPIIDTSAAGRKYKYVRIVTINKDGTKIIGNPITIK